MSITMYCYNCWEELELEDLYEFKGVEYITQKNGTDSHAFVCEACVDTKFNDQHNVILTQLHRDDINGYSLSQIATVMVCLNCDHEQAKTVCDFMDRTHNNPDWSESSWLDLIFHLNCVHSEMKNITETHVS